MKLDHAAEKAGTPRTNLGPLYLRPKTVLAAVGTVVAYEMLYAAPALMRHKEQDVRATECESRSRWG